MKEELSSSETSVLTRATQRNISEDTIQPSIQSPRLISTVERERERKSRGWKVDGGAEGRTGFLLYALSLSGLPFPDHSSFIFVMANEARKGFIKKPIPVTDRGGPYVFTVRYEHHLYIKK
jgi:hypothetical protein